jgi:hypothetical protein
MKGEYDKEKERAVRKGLTKAGIGMLRVGGKVRRGKKEPWEEERSGSYSHRVRSTSRGLDPPPVASWWER